MRMGMQQHSHSFLVLLLLVFIAGIVLSVPSTPRRSRVRRQNMKVRINASGDTIVMKFLRPNADTKLEGYILGYGSSMFSKQFIQLPENGQPYETEFDAEPKYLIAVQPIPTNDVKKHCTGKVELQKPLHLVIGSVTPTSVILSWGTLLRTPYEGNVMNDCLEEGHYTVRYRERHRKWNYQTCPTSDTVIDNLKPNTVYEFGVQPNAKDVTGVWSKPVIHNISSGGTEDKPRKIIVKRPINPVKPLLPGPRPPFPQRHVHPNRTQGRPPSTRKINSKTTLAPTTTTKKESLSTPGPTLPVVTKKPIGGRDLSRSVLPPFMEAPLRPKHRPPPHITTTVAAVTALQKNINKHLEHNSQQPQQRPQSQPHAQPPPKPQLRPQYQPQPKPYPQTQIPQLKPWVKAEPQPQPKQTSLPILQNQPQPPPTYQPKIQTQPQSESWPKQHPQSQPQTTPHLQVETQPKPTLQPKHQAQPQTQPQKKSQTQPQVPTLPQPTPVAHPQSQTQPVRETNPELQLTTKQQTEAKPTTKPKTISLQSNPNSQTRPKGPSSKKPNHKSKSENTPQTRNRQEPPRESKPRSQGQPPKKIQAQPKPSPPKPQPQPGIHFQTRTYSDPTKVTPRQAVPTAPSPPEEGKPLPRPALATEKADSYNQGTRVLKPSIAAVPRSPISSSVPQAGRNITRTRVPPQTPRISGRPFTPSKTSSSHSSSTPGATGGARHRGIAYPKHVVWPKEKTDKPMDLKQGGKESILKPFPLVTAKPKQERRQQHTTSSAPALNTSRFDMNDNSSVFSHSPVSDLDIMGKPRFVGPHVIYKTDKKPDEPCSITSSLSFFADEEGGDQNVTGPPRVPPTNLTVVTVEGCPSFVILDWQKTDNETREYEVVSTTKGPNGEEVSVLTTNQTHTAVENLKPESSYEFTVTPKNELGAGPSSDPVTFSTESADPRVSEHASGKDAIWTQFPFKSDDYSECNGKQYVKRTWYRKFVGIQLCNSLRYKLYMSDSLTGKFYNIGDQTGHGEDHCQFVDSFLDGRTGTQMFADQLPSRQGFYRAMRQEPVHFGEIGGKSHVTYVGWYECGTPIPGKW
ncbi:target of Nesh-SH3 isoform X2 [Gymnodraco acuticeps]|uniref:Target of Nesh-SH3 isoform X2 n=1 Tax=Gymnodraco acuticeps TaxID=8218 RepID=A0A6P8TZ38_GYMAC|nr:target of Nesh-SH3 isoform X2 [Gymnodraco acuticeps]